MKNNSVVEHQTFIDRLFYKKI